MYTNYRYLMKQKIHDELSKHLKKNSRKLIQQKHTQSLTEIETLFQQRKHLSGNQLVRQP